MKIKQVLIEGFIPIVLTLFLDFECKYIILSFMVTLQIVGFAAYFVSEKKHSLLSSLYSICLVTYYIECGTQINSTLLFMLYFLQVQITIIRNIEWSKMSLLINAYALFRVCQWTQQDFITLSGGVVLVLIQVGTLYLNKPITPEPNISNLSFKKCQEKCMLNHEQTPPERKLQYHSSTLSLELQDCFHFFNLIPDSLVLLTAKNLSVHFCNAATMEMFRISDKVHFKECLEQLTEVIHTTVKPEIRDPRDSFPSFQSFQQTFQFQQQRVMSKLSREEIDINQLLTDLRSIRPTTRLLQILRNSPHSTVMIGNYLANWNENAGVADLEQPNKRLLEINAHAAIIDEKLMVLLQIRDVTHRDYIKSMKKSYQAKSNTMSFVSHEYRTPLNSIIQFITALQDEKDPITQSKYIKIALSNCKYLLNLSNDLLDLAQLKAGKFSIVPVEMDLRKLIEECLELFKLEAIQKKINLQLIYRKSAPSLLTNDPNRIRQIIINLLGNAFKYTLQGYIEVKVSNYHHNQLKIEVHDTGLGIKEEHKEKLMHAFTRVDDNESKKLNPQGVGLGLMISSMIARNLTVGEKGLQFQSEYQSGSSFWFYVSKNIYQCEIQEETEDVDEESPERRQSLWRYNNIKQQQRQKCICAPILIVDDNAFNIEVLKFLILKIDPQLKIECSLDAPTAIQMVKLNRCNKCKGYEKVFMDIDMPTMNGLEATQLIKAQFPRIQIIGCSGYARPEEEHLAIQNGMDAYLVKPIQIDQLKQHLR